MDRMKATKRDYIIIAVLMAIYAAIAFFNLGDKKAPETMYAFSGDESVLIDLGNTREIGKISYFLGNYHECEFTLETALTEDGPFSDPQEFTMNSVFSWGEFEYKQSARWVRLTFTGSKAAVNEVIFYDINGNKIPVLSSVPASASVLYDEQEIYPGRKTFKNSTYFDEIYHARTAYEYMNGLYSYENTHPPLGKVFISLGMDLFGVNPFGWRFMGTLFGVLMIPILYLLAFRMFRSTFISTLASILFTFDFMHFAQTRIATIDVFVTLFIMLSYYFMYEYIQEGKKKWLLFGGIAMGLSIACKWTGIYSSVGLAIIFFLHLFFGAKEHKEAEQRKQYWRQQLHTCLWCLLFFCLIPAAIYVLSYLPFRDGSESGFLMQMIKNQETMFSYHNGVDATHPYSSWWYQWPTMYRPIWYYSGTVSEGVKEGISAFGNPLVWWAGIAAFVYCVIQAIRKKDRLAVFLIIGYLAQYLPWIPIQRITFIYHYFPSVPFVVLMIAYVMKDLWLQYPKQKMVQAGLISYVSMAVILFLLFYPVLSGLPVSENYVDHFLRWFDSWVLI